MTDPTLERCGCRSSVKTMGTMVRNGRDGHGHYTHDGCYMGPCDKGANVTEQYLKIVVTLTGPPDKDKEQAFLDITKIVDKTQGAEIYCVTPKKVSDAIRARGSQGGAPSRGGE